MNTLELVCGVVLIVLVCAIWIGVALSSDVEYMENNDHGLD